MKTNDKLDRLKKFFIDKKVRNIALFADFVVLALYIALLFIINNADLIKGLQNNSLSYQILDVISEITLIAFSIISTTLFSSWLIETNKQNKIYSDIVCNDFLASPEFYNALGDNNKRTMLNNFEKQYYFNGSEKREEMYNSITNKLQFSDDVYYDSCNYEIDCKIDGNLLRKTITRTTKLFSYDEECDIENLPLIASTYRKIDSIEGFTFKSLHITENGKNEKNILENELHIETDKVKDNALKKCGYTDTIEYSLRKKIHLRKQLSKNDIEGRGVVVKIQYGTVVGIDDSSYVCRVKYPCKHFSVNFKLSGKEAAKYELSSHSFGFIEKATDSDYNDNRTVVNISFDNWIFKSDGVAIVISEKIT